MLTLLYDNLMSWMLINLILAFIPLVMAFIIFNRRFWKKNIFLNVFLIFSSVIFFLFLPNAPYTLTDLIHLVRQIKDYKYFRIKDVEIMFFLIPEYLVFIFLGLSFYTIALKKFITFLSGYVNNNKKLLFAIKVAVHFLMSIGVYLGRVYRYSSWDFIFHINRMIGVIGADLSDRYIYLYVIYYTVAFTVIYELLKIFLERFILNKISVEQDLKKP